MQSTDDSALLRNYVQNNSEDAFATLVTRHVNLVYSVAMRSIGNPSAAEEITQAVFIILAQKAGQLRNDKAISSWLFQTTRLTANNFLRTELRRQRREQEAYNMQTILNEPEPKLWPKIAPLLDNAIAALNEKDRRAILLRFYEGKNLSEIGTVLGATEAAMEKRVSRAVEKLQKFFFNRGVTSTAEAITENISVNSIQTAPAALIKSVTTVAIAKGATASASTLTLVKGALKIMAWTKMKTAIVAGIAVVLATGTTLTTVAYVKKHAAQGQTQMQDQLSEKQGFIPMSQWTFKGYDTPEAGYESFNWALRQGNLKTFLNQFTPEFRQIEIKGIGTRPDAVIESNMQKEASQVGAYLIASNQMVFADECILHIRSPKIGNGKVRIKKINGEWKVDSAVTPDRAR